MNIARRVSNTELPPLTPLMARAAGLEAEGRTTRMCQEQEIQEAMMHGPLDTRGGLRGLCVQRFGKDITSIQWEGVSFSSHNGKLYLDLQDHLEPVSVAECRSGIEQAETPLDMMEFTTVEQIP